MALKLWWACSWKLLDSRFWHRHSKVWCLFVPGHIFFLLCYSANVCFFTNESRAGQCFKKICDTLKDFRWKMRKFLMRIIWAAMSFIFGDLDEEYHSSSNITVASQGLLQVCISVLTRGHCFCAAFPCAKCIGAQGLLVKYVFGQCRLNLVLWKKCMSNFSFLYDDQKRIRRHNRCCCPRCEFCSSLCFISRAIYFLDASEVLTSFAIFLIRRLFSGSGWRSSMATFYRRTVSTMTSTIMNFRCSKTVIFLVFMFAEAHVKNKLFWSILANDVHSGLWCNLTSATVTLCYQWLEVKEKVTGALMGLKLFRRRRILAPGIGARSVGEIPLIRIVPVQQFSSPGIAKYCRASSALSPSQLTASHVAFPKMSPFWIIVSHGASNSWGHYVSSSHTVPLQHPCQPLKWLFYFMQCLQVPGSCKLLLESLPPAPSSLRIIASWSAWLHSVQLWISCRKSRILTGSMVHCDYYQGMVRHFKCCRLGANQQKTLFVTRMFYLTLWSYRRKC